MDYPIPICSHPKPTSSVRPPLYTFTRFVIRRSSAAQIMHFLHVCLAPPPAARNGRKFRVSARRVTGLTVYASVRWPRGCTEGERKCNSTHGQIIQLTHSSCPPPNSSCLVIVALTPVPNPRSTITSHMGHNPAPSPTYTTFRLAYGCVTCDAHSVGHRDSTLPMAYLRLNEWRSSIPRLAEVRFPFSVSRAQAMSVLRW